MVFSIAANSNYSRFPPFTPGLGSLYTVTDYLLGWPLPSSLPPRHYMLFIRKLKGKFCNHSALSECPLQIWNEDTLCKAPITWDNRVRNQQGCSGYLKSCQPIRSKGIQETFWVHFMCLLNVFRTLDYISRSTLCSQFLGWEDPLEEEIATHSSIA